VLVAVFGGRYLTGILNRRKPMHRTSLAAFIAVTLLGGAASAQQMCNALMATGGGALPPPLYVSGSTALEPLLKQIGPKIAALGTNPYTVVYLKDGSCSGVARLYTGGGTIAAATTMLYLPPDYVAGTAVPSCTVPAGGVTGDLVLSDVDGSLCPGNPALPAGVTDFHGPVNDMVFVVPSTSTQKTMSAEMAYLVFGMGMAGNVSPWVDPMYYFIRATDSGTRAMINANIGVGAHAWLGQAQSGSGGVFMMVSAQQNVQPEKTIGILGEDYYDQGNNRTSVKALAFRAFKQNKAFWPDSSLTARDRKNVREGRYKIWGYVHMLAATNGGTVTSPGADFFIKLMTSNLGAATPTTFDIQDVITDSHLTPVCAMKVAHDIEGGDQKPPVNPPPPCGCSFEARATGAMPPGCTACTTTCPGSGVCRKGFCETN
jgi:ABC-type phosphate transport system substrate-binding protein